jgi:hypothetical protein
MVSSALQNFGQLNEIYDESAWMTAASPGPLLAGAAEDNRGAASSGLPSVGPAALGIVRITVSGRRLANMSNS